MFKTRLLALTLLLLLTTSCVKPAVSPTPTPVPTPVPTPTPAPKPVPASPFGITTSGRFDYDTASQVKDLGAKWMRVVVMPWATLEVTEGSYFWSPLDMWVAQAAEADVELVVTVTGYAPGIFSPGNPALSGGRIANPWYFSVSPEAKLRGYENFLREMVRRYRGRVRYWQIDNEVTMKEFWDASLEDYIAVLQIAYTVIKGEDPESSVLLAGFATDTILPPEQVQLLLEQGRGYFDILDVHIYKPAETIDTTTIDTTIAFFYEQMRRAGYKRPLWITETGAPNLRLYRSETEPPPEMQASEVVKRYTAALSAGAERVFWFYLGGSIPPDELVWKSTQPVRQPMQNFRHMALVRNDERRLAFTTYQVMVSKLEGYTVLLRLDLGKGVSAFRFRKSSGDVFVLWADRDTVASLPVGAGRVTVTDVYGKTVEMESTQIRLTKLPIFVEELP